MQIYTHSQSTPSTTWTINHNLGCKPVFDVWVDEVGGRQKIFPASVVHVSDNTMLLGFSLARTGTARLAGVQLASVFGG